jgi:hypothetical protein
MWSLANPRVQAAIVCLLIAVVYLFLWPGRKHPERFRQRPFWRRTVLRWFHSLTWIFVALACLLWSRALAGVAFAVYLVFLITAARERSATGP